MVMQLPQEWAWQAVLLVTGLVLLSHGSDGATMRTGVHLSALSSPLLPELFEDVQPVVFYDECQRCHSALRL
ncbi:hypothetical protein PAMP_013291 [Pampus punctatissimus]